MSKYKQKYRSKHSKVSEMSAQNNHLIKMQSFSDRICDDLCEVLLKYLSFEDKIKFECVSKQFQRLIFNKQNKLRLDFFGDSDPNTLNQLINCDRSHCSGSIKSEAFESVVKKCKFIDNIVVKSNKKFSIPNAKQILRIIECFSAKGS
jgi:hypothetical protein